MSEILKLSRVNGTHRISTVRTDAGGGSVSTAFGSPFNSGDYSDETPWPFETMVFAAEGATGLYHEAHATEKEALEAHERISEAVLRGTFEIGRGVRGPFGVPSMTPKEWSEQLEATRNRRQNHANQERPT